MQKYWLIQEPTGHTAKQLSEKIGLVCRDTHLGMLVEQPPSLRGLADTMFEIRQALDPRRHDPNACTCGAWALMHCPSCPMYGKTV